jgi:hypothetical protein
LADELKMSNRDEKLRVTDKKGFVPEIEIKYKPNLGFAIAYHKGTIIASVELGKIREPMSDDEREWEMYEERLSEWVDEIKTNLIPMCVKYFNNQYTK